MISAAYASVTHHEDLCESEVSICCQCEEWGEMGLLHMQEPPQGWGGIRGEGMQQL